MWVAAQWVTQYYSRRNLTLAGCPALQDELLRFATQEPLAIVVELDCMRARTAAALMVFPAVAIRIREWPGVRVVLAVSRQPLRALVDTSVVPGFIPTYHSVSGPSKDSRARRLGASVNYR